MSRANRLPLPVATLALGALLLVAASAVELFALWQASPAAGFTAAGSATAGLESAARWSPLNWRYPYRLGRLDRALGRNEKAAQRFRHAIELYPGCGHCWVALAEARAAQGLDPRAELERAVAHGSATTTVRTRTAVLYARLGQRDEALREFSAALGGHRKDRTGFYDQLAVLYPADFVLDEIVEDIDLPSFFGWARRRATPELAARTWARYSRYEDSDRARPWYVDYLIAHGFVHEAWRVAFGSRPGAVAAGEPALINSDFEDLAGVWTRRPGEAGRAEVGGARQRFAWRVQDGRDKAEGVTARVVHCGDCAQGRRALRLRFDGEHNPHYTATSQYLPVEPGRRYSLTAQVRYQELGSVSGPRIVVQGVAGRRGVGGGLEGGGSDDPSAGCRMWVQGEQYRGNSDWRATELEFEVPSDCEGARVLVFRSATKALDRFIGGELWLDDFALALLPGEELSSEEPAQPAAGFARNGGGV